MAIDAEPEEEPESGPLRRCVVTRERLPKEQMIRFVLGPGRVLVPDLQGRLPGRGLWLSASAGVLERAGAQGERALARSFARAARGPVVVPPGLPAVLETALIRRVTETLGLTRRAGQAVAGFEKAREWVTTGRAALIVQAADGSETERTRLLSGARSLPAISPLPGAALGQVFGRDHVVHVAVAPGKLARTLMIEAGRLAGLRQTGQNTARQQDDVGATEQV